MSGRLSRLFLATIVVVSLLSSHLLDLLFALSLNCALIRLNKHNAAASWTMSLPFEQLGQISRRGELALEAPNPNWSQDPVAVGLSEPVFGMLAQGMDLSMASPRRLRLLARIESFAGHPEIALGHLLGLARAESCDDLQSNRLACSQLWIDVGDVLDQLDQTLDALTYYRAGDWLRRHEAGVELSARVLDSGAVPKSAEVEESLTAVEILLPNALVTQYMRSIYGEDAASIDQLCCAGDPRLALATRRDPRLEKRTAEIVADLVRLGVWDQATLARVLAFRAWQVDLHSFDYQNYSRGKLWSPQRDADPMQLAALSAFFDHLSHRLPDNPFVWWAKGEFLERWGECASADSAYERAEQLGLPEAWMEGQRSGTPRCSNRRSEVIVFPDGDGALASTDFGLWRSWGGALNVASTPSTRQGFDDAAVGWVWGPDTLHTFQSAPSFRADCVWRQEIAEQRSAPLLSTLLERGEGKALALTVPRGQRLIVDYWWRARGDIHMTYRGSEIIEERNLGYEEGWHHSQWAFAPVDQDREVNLSWALHGCGSFWLGRMAVRLLPE